MPTYYDYEIEKGSEILDKFIIEVTFEGVIYYLAGEQDGNLMFDPDINLADYGTFEEAVELKQAFEEYQPQFGTFRVTKLKEDQLEAKEM